jgi:hypothetical protein
MFRPLLSHHQVYCLCVGDELDFNTDIYFEYDYKDIILCLVTKLLILSTF